MRSPKPRFPRIVFGFLALAVVSLTAHSQASGARGPERVLWSFGNGSDGFSPHASLILDTSGNLYGETILGGAYPGPNGYGAGTVCELIQPSSTSKGKWTESILWSFNGADGYLPEAGLIMDKSGNLYGTTGGGGGLQLRGLRRRDGVRAVTSLDQWGELGRVDPLEL